MIVELVLAGVILMLIWWVFKYGLIWPLLGLFVLLFLAVDSHHKAILLNNPLEGSTFKLVISTVLSVISVLFVEWTVRRQFLFREGSYHLLLFSVFFWILPINRWDLWLWIASLLLWLSFINIIKVDANTNSNNFIFNAGFWLVFSIFFKVDFFYFYLCHFVCD